MKNFDLALHEVELKLERTRLLREQTERAFRKLRKSTDNLVDIMHQAEDLSNKVDDLLKRVRESR